MPPTQEIDIHQIVFGDGMAEVTYSEERDQTPDIQKISILRLDQKRSGRVIEELISDMKDLVDHVLERLRDDPDELPGR